MLFSSGLFPPLNYIRRHVPFCAELKLRTACACSSVRVRHRVGSFEGRVLAQCTLVKFAHVCLVQAGSGLGFVPGAATRGVGGRG